MSQKVYQGVSLQIPPPLHFQREAPGNFLLRKSLIKKVRCRRPYFFQILAEGG